LQLAGWLNQQRGDLKFLRRALRVLETLELSEQEKEEVGLVQAGEMLRWRDEERRFSIKLEDEDFKLLSQALEATWPVNALILAMLEHLESQK